MARELLGRAVVNVSVNRDYRAHNVVDTYQLCQWGRARKHWYVRSADRSVRAPAFAGQSGTRSSALRGAPFRLFEPCSFLSLGAHLNPSPVPVAADDEAYWAAVRAQYPVTPDFINL